MRSITTRAININAPYQQAFDYIANPMNQKDWAINFIKDIRPAKAGFIAKTPMGETHLHFATNKEQGTIDMIMEGGVPIRTRLIPNELGCTYIFSLAKPPLMPDPAWEADGIPGLEEELQVLKSILEENAKAMGS